MHKFAVTLKIYGGAVLAAFILAVLLPGTAMAAPPAFVNMLGNCSTSLGIGRALCNVVLSSTFIPALISGIAYLIGLVFAFSGVLKLKEHVLYPDRVSIWEPAKRFLAGGGLFALPIVTEAVYSTIVGSGFGGLAPYTYTGFAANVSGGGLDVMMVALVKDLWHPLQQAMGGFAYLAGLIFVVIGITRLVKTAQDGPRGPGGFGTIMTFATAGVFFSLDRLMGTFATSMFGNSQISTMPALQYTAGLDPNVEVAHAEAVITAIVGFVALVGWVSFIRGWFIIRGVAEGNQQASLMAGVTHILGGALAVNLGPLMNAVQFTLGLQGVGVLFG